MKKKYYLLLIVICFSLLNANTLRNLSTISVESTGNLVYDSESKKVKFEVNVESSIDVGNSYTLTTKIKSTQIEIANCEFTSDDQKKLKCSIDSENPYYGSVILVGSSYEDNQASIQLSSADEITILQKDDIELEFTKSYDLTSSSSTCTFKIDIKSQESLVNEAYVQVDITKDGVATVAECTLNELILT